ncbi:MAG: hypothetical protein NTY09_13345 [bacterium]|nr:hypothetical protein [bacterium]
MDMKSQKNILLLTSAIFLFSIAFCLGTGINAAVNESQDKNQERVNSEAEIEQSNEILDSVPYLFEPIEKEYRPILPEYLLEIQNINFSHSWSLDLNTYFGEERVKLMVNYSPDSNSLQGTFMGGGSKIVYDFSSAQPFLDFIQFVSDNQDVILDQSEYQFECVPDDWNSFSQDGVLKESFVLSFAPGFDSDLVSYEYSYVMMKWLIPGQENPPELIEVARLIRSLFLEEVLSQENDTGFSMADDTFLERVVTE